MKRNLKFWTRYNWEFTGLMLAIAAVLSVVAVFGAEGLDLRTFATVVPYFLCIGAALCILLSNTGTHTLYMPLLMSMGETRRNVLLGFHYFRALTIAVTVALCAVIWLVVPGEVSSQGLRSIPTILCVLIIASAMGSIMGTVFSKWKWLGTIIIIVICGFAGGTVGFAGATMADGLAVAKTMELAAYLVTMPWWLAAAAPVSLALDVAFHWMLLRRQEVKL